MADKTSTFSVRVKGESNADQTAKGVEELRVKLYQAQEETKRYSTAMRNLRGNTDQVTAAKKKLKAGQEAARGTASQLQLALLKQGSTLGALKPKIEEAKKETNLFDDAMKSMTPTLTGVAVAMLAVAAAVGAGVIALAKWIVEQGNMLRTQGLFAEAAAGAETLKAFGHQADALAQRVPIARGKLVEMFTDMARGFNGTRVSGQGAVDTFNAVAQASAAMGDKAGSKIQEIIERSKNFGRMGIGRFELQGTGIHITEVASQLSKDLKISLADAQQQLRFGFTNVNAGAKAIREVIEKKFGGINLRHMMSLEALSTKLKDNLTGLISDVDFEPFLSQVQDLVGLFDKTSDTGKAMKSILEDFAKATGKAFQISTPHVKAFVEEFILDMLRFELSALRAAVFIKEKFGVNLTKTFDDTTMSVKAAKIAFAALEFAVVGTAAGVAALVGYVVAVDASIKGVQKALASWWDDLTGKDWRASGLAIAQGLAAGLTGGTGLIITAITTMGKAVKDRFKEALGIHSPSTVFEEYGRQTNKGYQRGLDSEKPVAALPAAPAAQARASAPSGGNTFNITLQVDAKGAGSAEELRAAMTGPGMKAALLKALQEMLRNAGLPST